MDLGKMVGESGFVGDDPGLSSPRNKVKFLCSHGGKILLKPGDGHLKYVGGETRVIAVPRDISFSELMKKVTVLTEGDMILKYQLASEDLDALVSVRSDADLKHMFDELDRHVGGVPMLRTFLFPSKPVVSENQAAVSEPHTMLEQRYIDAINGIIHTSPAARHGPIRVVSSACSSPKSRSPDGHTVDPIHESFFRSNKVSSMHRVRSSPSISSLNNLQNHSNGHGNHSSPQYDHNYYHHQNHHQHHPHGHPSARLSPDPQIGFGFGRPPPTLSLVRLDSGRSNGGSNHYYQTGRSNGHKASPGYFKCGHHDESLPSAHIRFERNNSAPRPPSPR